MAVARTLSQESQDVTIIESDPRVARKVEETLDCLCLVGNGASTRMLEQAGARRADLLLAVTRSDEVNIVACMLASRFEVGTTVARVRNPELGSDSFKFPGINLMINPDAVAAAEIAKLVSTPEATEVEYFADGKVHLLGFKVDPRAPAVGAPLAELSTGVACLVVAIARNGHIIIPHGDDRILANDTIFVVGAVGTASSLGWLAGRSSEQIRNVVIVGGGEIGLRLAHVLEQHHQVGVRVKVIESDGERCLHLAQELEHAMVVHGNGTDLDLLTAEGVARAGAVVVVTGNDEVNVLVGLLAKQLGAGKTIVSVERRDYAALVDTLGIDATIRPRLLTANAILRFVRKGTVMSVATLRESEAEAIEFLVTGDCPIAGKRLSEAGFPRGALIGAVVRADRVLVPRGSDRIQPGDRAIVFTLTDRVAAVERFFAHRPRGS